VRASCCSTIRSAVAADTNTTLITPRQAVVHFGKAQEYLRAAEHALGIGDHNAAAGTAIDAGTNAADAVAGMNLGRRWKGPHEQAARFVAGAGVEGRDVAKELRRLLQFKTQAQYSSDPIAPRKATACVEAARRAVAVAARATARAADV
jgi:hypothetical protein